MGEVIAKQMKKLPMWGKLRPDSTQKYLFMSKNLNRAKKKLHNVRTGNVYTCLEYPTCPQQALGRLRVPQRVGEGSGARLKPKSTT